MTLKLVSSAPPPPPPPATPYFAAFDALTALSPANAQLLIAKLIESLPIDRVRQIITAARSRIIYLEDAAARKAEALRLERQRAEIGLDRNPRGTRRR